MSNICENRSIEASPSDDAELIWSIEIVCSRCYERLDIRPCLIVCAVARRCRQYEQSAAAGRTSASL